MVFYGRIRKCVCFRHVRLTTIVCAKAVEAKLFLSKIIFDTIVPWLPHQPIKLSEMPPNGLGRKSNSKAGIVNGPHRKNPYQN